MKYLSVCSGIEAASVAWHPLGFEPVAFSEIEAFPSAVLAERWPGITNLGDMTKFQSWPDYAISLLVGGTPCQSFSVAGLRKGLADPRGNLALTYLAIAARYRPRWILWENVPGVLSDKGNAFGCFLAGLAELGYGWAYRVLNAQHFGIPQRRRRVFVVGYLGDWRRAAAVLFERHSLSGNPPPRRQAGKDAAPTISARTRGGGGLGADFDCDGGLIPETVGALTDGAHNGGGSTDRTPTPAASLPLLANPLTARMQKGPNTTCDEGQTLIPTRRGGSFDDTTHTLRGEGFDASEDGTGRGTPLVPVAFNNTGHGFWNESDAAATVRKGDDNGNGGARESTIVAFSSKDHDADAGDISPTLRSMGHDGSHANGGGQVAVAFAENSRAELRLCGGDGQTSSQLTTGGGKPGQGHPCIVQNMLTRRAEPDTFSHAHAIESDSVKALRLLRREVGAQTFAEWGLGILASFRPQEVLQSAVHGIGLRCATVAEFGLVNYALARPKDGCERLVREMRRREREGCSPFGWGPHEQQSRKLAAYLSVLSQPGASAEGILQDLWKASEGAGLLRNALPAFQEVGEPIDAEGQPILATAEGIRGEPEAALFCQWVWKAVSRARPLQPARHAGEASTGPEVGSAVRRLVPVECEFLQGFPRNYTLITYRGKPVSDGPRYKALGNSMAVPCMRWIGERIQSADAMSNLPG